MDKRKKVKFDYVRVITSKWDINKRVSTDHKPFKLEVLLNEALSKSIEERTSKYYGEEVILQRIEKIEKEHSTFWKLQFVKQRTAEVPGIIIKGPNEYKPLELEENEYIGEEVSALYHEDTNVLMIQRNRNALGVTGIQTFFNNVLYDLKNVIELKPVPFTSNIKELKKLKLRKIEVNFADVLLDSDKNSALINVIRGARKIESLNTKVTFSIGRGSKDRSLSPEEVESFIGLTKDEGFKKIHLEYRIDEDAPLEIVELVNGVLVDESIMEYSKDKRICYDRVIINMEYLFKDRISYLKRIFNVKKR